MASDLPRRLVVNFRDSRPIWSIPDWAITEIRDLAGSDFEVVVVDAQADGRGDGGPASEEAIKAAVGAEVYLGFGFPRGVYDAAREAGNLRWVHSGTAGIGGSLHPGLVDSNVMLTNSAGISGEPMADSVMAGIYYFARGLDLAVSAQSKNLWDNARFSAPGSPVHELRGTTLGIAGYGGIGRAVARRASALGMKVLALRRRDEDEASDVEVLTGPTGLERLIRESRYLLLALPLTAHTRHFLDRERIAQLRSDAVVINVGRGESADEEALDEALRDKRIRGAMLDVFANEPLPAESPLWNRENVLITPHVSATTDEFWAREMELLRDNFRRYTAGRPLQNVVDKKAGY